MFLNHNIDIISRFLIIVLFIYKIKDIYFYYKIS